MNKFYKRFLFLIVLLAVISCGVIYFTIDINTFNNLTSFQPWSIILAIILVSIGLILDGTRLMHLVRISNEHITLQQAVQVVFGNYFLALLTPGATGGAVAQLIFLRHAGIPTGKATVFVIVRTLVSILFLLLCLPIIFYYDIHLLPWISAESLMYASACIVILILLAIWAFKTNFPDYVVIKISKKFPRNRRRMIFSFYHDIKGAVLLLSSAPFSMFRVFIESGLSLIAIYSVVPILFLGMGAEANWHIIMGRMIFLNILLYFAPTPGGSGIAEGGFVLLFSDFLPSGTVGIVAVAWRIIVEYLPFSIGFYYTVKVFGRDFLNKQMNK
ncbi:lysylphosphatidylglycerol synthase transmembrane domain-containing protein [Anaerosinus massiliensis]|uniref:lysylphosphatidylglycerol synthase transmembrane domain-containing protein n=1 Tax=Massilibacillus massiliensis TaxID=1806837 RepID=UPI000ABC2D82|nr:lysylphosphatidylglycerol synthase transmembrane domain-containing protein [Massilibacillus massiliensis]